MLWLVLAFVLGIHIGSFLNVCIWRLPRRESVVQPPSHCPRCDTRLRPLDLVPLLSQVLLRARCRYCHAKISWRYFGIELLTGILYVLAALYSVSPDATHLGGFEIGDPAQIVRLVQAMVVVTTLVVIFWIDYDTRLIQLESVLILGLAGLACDAWRAWQAGGANLTDGPFPPGITLLPAPMPESILAMIVTAGLLWGVRELFSMIYRREAMGFGDIILVAAIAANIGWHGTLFTFFFLSVTVGALIGIAVRIPHAVRAYRWAQRREALYQRPARAGALARHAFRKVMPFGPMLALGAVIAMFYGEQINQSYMTLVNPPMTMPAGMPAYGGPGTFPGP